MTCCEDKTKRELVEKQDGKLVERCTACGRMHVRLSFTPFSLSGETREQEAKQVNNTVSTP
jgi:uncharacterized Zn finger protein